MRNLVVLILLAVLSVGLVAVQQLTPEGEAFLAKSRGTALEGVSPIYVYIQFETKDAEELQIDEGEIRDRVHLAFFRGQVEFKEATFSDWTASILRDDRTVITFNVYSQPTIGSTFQNEIDVLLSEHVRPIRDPEMLLLVATYSDTVGGWAGRAVARDQLYRYASEAADRFVQSYKANN